MVTVSKYLPVLERLVDVKMNSGACGFSVAWDSHQKLESAPRCDSGASAEVAERLCDGLQSRSMEVRILPSAPKVNQETQGTATNSIIGRNIGPSDL